MIHQLLARSIDEQCHFATPNGDSGYLNCALKAGHQSLGFDHVDTYDALAGRTTSTCRTQWFVLPAEEVQRLSEGVRSITMSGGEA
jgi:hypothetical protein